MKNTGIEYSSTDRTPIVLPELAELLPPLTGEQLGVLEADLMKNGCYAPIIVNEELVIIDLQNDVLKIDGNYAVAWSSSLNFTVERSGKSLIGSAASGEGLVNVYRGTGRVMMQPVR